MTLKESADQTLRLLASRLSAVSGERAHHWLVVPAPALEAESLLEAELEQDALYWSTGSENELVGVGVAERLTARGPERFVQLDEQLKRLWSSFELGGAREPGAPEPTVVGGLAFQLGRSSHEPWSDFGEGQFVLPRLTYARRDERAWLCLAVSDRELGSAVERERWVNAAARLVRSAAGRVASDTASQAPARFRLSERPEGEWHELGEAIRRASAARAFRKAG